jgi:hypothetical protein
MCALQTAIIGFCVLNVASNIQAASAAAVAINPKGGLGYGYAHYADITEAEAKRRALRECQTWNGRDARIIASTSKFGFGAVIWLLRSDNKLDYTAVLAAPTWQIAVSQAKQKAKSLGGRGFKIVAGWNDAPPGKRRPIIMQKL